MSGAPTLPRRRGEDEPMGGLACGDTPDAALQMLKEAVELYIENAVQLGIWEDVRPAVESSVRFTAPLAIAVP